VGNILASHQLGDVLHSHVVFHLEVQRHAVVHHHVRLLKLDVHLHVACRLNGAVSAQCKYAVGHQHGACSVQCNRDCTFEHVSLLVLVQLDAPQAAQSSPYVVRNANARYSIETQQATKCKEGAQLTMST